MIGLELAATCPPGGPIAFGDCARVRPFAIGVVGLAAALYVVGLSAVRWWTVGLQRRGVADARAARDWYLLAAGARAGRGAASRIHARIGPSLG